MAKPNRAHQVAEGVARQGLPQLKARLGRQVQRSRQRHRQEVRPGRALAGRDGHMQRVPAPGERLRLVYRACTGSSRALLLVTVATTCSPMQCLHLHWQYAHVQPLRLEHLGAGKWRNI